MPILNYEKLLNQMARENKLGVCILKYKENGIKGIANKIRFGNPIAK